MGSILKTLGKAHSIDFLNLLQHNSGGVQFNQIKYLLGIDAKTITRLLEEMEKTKLVEIRRTGNVSIITITLKGTRILKMALEIEK